MLEKMGEYSNQVEVVKVLGYEHEFWVDVRHNRARNSPQEAFLVEDRVVANPNATLLLTTEHPSLPIRYIVKKHKRPGHAMHFCSKAELIVRLNKVHLRRVKVEWDGPSNQPMRPRDYRVIDYEDLMHGNPTIPNVFQF
jgi:hypothetical protein